MKQDMLHVFWCALALAVSVSLSGCSLLPDAVSGTVSNLNPFQQQAPAPQPEAAPTKEVTPAASIRVQAKPPAPPKGAVGLEVNVGNNKQCTTFCAIPMRKPAVK